MDPGERLVHLLVENFSASDDSIDVLSSVVECLATDLSVWLSKLASKAASSFLFCLVVYRPLRKFLVASLLLRSLCAVTLAKMTAVKVKRIAVKSAPYVSLAR